MFVNLFQAILRTRMHFWGLSGWIEVMSYLRFFRHFWSFLRIFSSVGAKYRGKSWETDKLTQNSRNSKKASPGGQFGGTIVFLSQKLKF